ncbi:hypothetical protein Glove_13g187 [Diversispora epigaea]|uniref:Protein kinase domain-containing protein n=1 Tax=Diversispora epigaea TaxID=1348612 RepID=A0A397JMS3_9GLOM|nr:hypothetical protein Glove_13g187 [Diversispora epigaea]
MFKCLGCNQKYDDIKAKGGYGTIHYAKWVDGYIESWIIENQQWKRNGHFEVLLKKLNNITTILLRISCKITSTTLYGITKDPETHEYMMVL